MGAANFLYQDKLFVVETDDEHGVEIHLERMTTHKPAYL